MISVYALVKTKTKTQLTGAWRGGEHTAPDDCLRMETRTGIVETHYWIEKGDAEPKLGKKCLCGRVKYSG